ncbi:MAG: peptide chain release factor N(5)-glutamine methyltransferase [Hydrogenimonas sp.]|nr:MAG: peptide chain release factor N(5)-glutamine methyltransferase [Hydrogenimonas sp.]
MTIDEALRDAVKMIASVAERPRLEAEILMAEHLGKERIWLHTHGDQPLENIENFFQLIERRAKSEPIEYILGRVSFYDLELKVGPGVLIARPETELLVDKAAEVIRIHNLTRVAEIGVGSGAISIMLAKLFPMLEIIATDISKEALEYARYNVQVYGLEDRIRLQQADLLEGVEEPIEMVVSNPPYISEDYQLPAPLHYEPKGALVGGSSGDELLQRIISTVKQRAIPHLVCEMGYDQRQPITTYCQHLNLPEPIFYKDLAGLDRGFYLKLR